MYHMSYWIYIKRYDTFNVWMLFDKNIEYIE